MVRVGTSPRPQVSGAGAAAILAAGVGALALGVLALAGDASPAIGRALILWPPSGPLSGVTSAAVAVWLLVWLVLDRRWSDREVPLRPVNFAAIAMLAAGLLLTFPPFMDLVQGR
jgi:hypothetical protein